MKDSLNKYKKQLYDGGAGAVTGDVILKEFDIHFEKNKPGSENENPTE